MLKSLLYILLIITILLSCSASKPEPVPGASQFEKYRQLLDGKSVGVVANQTSMVGDIHLIDYLTSEGVNLKAIFAPEHGFRELADAGAKIDDSRDAKTGLPIISLYGSHRKPTSDDLNGIDVILFDIQDVGARFYTYISTLDYVLEACAENNVECIILDRPNPNGFYYDGNILDTAYSTFVGLHPVPVVHGMTIGEYGLMINGEGWLNGAIKCKISVIPCQNYKHSTYYELPIKPSPNLPNQNSIYLYPSLCWFEGTNISVGRGTDFPFQLYGSPELPDKGFSFTPKSTAGASNPPFKGVKCFGVNLSDALNNEIVPKPMINLEWVIDAYNDYPNKEEFFTKYFDTLAGGPTLREQIQSGMSAQEIRDTWVEGLKQFGKIRDKYLLYKN